MKPPARAPSRVTVLDLVELCDRLGPGRARDRVETALDDVIRGALRRGRAPAQDPRV